MGDKGPWPRNEERELLVLDGIKSGKTYEKIGEELGITRQRVYAIVKRAKADGKI